MQIDEATSPVVAETAIGNRPGRTTAVASPPSAPGTRLTAIASRGVARMQHDAWPPLPPGGHRPADAPPFTSPGDQLLALGLGATAGGGALVWASGQLAGLALD